MSKVYYDPGGDIYGLWIVNENGTLVYVRTPIRVLCIISIADFKSGITYYVEAVLGDVDGAIILFIFNKPVKHTYFKITGVK